MTTQGTIQELPEDAARQIAALLGEAARLATEAGEEVVAELRRAEGAALDVETARRLYEKIIAALDGATGTRRAAEEVAALVESAVGSAERSATPEPIEAAEGVDSGERSREIQLRSMHGMDPHPVVPVPTFNGYAVPMEEGYVDVNDLALWAGNNRIDLQVQEFEERNHRKPNAQELVRLMHGEIDLPSVGKRDPFNILPLARSIARKGVERQPILTAEGEPKDGNRRIAAAIYVQNSEEFSAEEKERARYIRVWKAPPNTTEDQYQAIVVALNFEDDLKEEWDEYIKARLVAERYETLETSHRGRLTTQVQAQIKREVAEYFAITTQYVTRYLKMVRWADDFEDFHINERGRDAASVRYKANDDFQRFIELDAGKGQSKITNQIAGDDELREVVYDLMWDTIKSGTEVRQLHQIVENDDALALLWRAHGQLRDDVDEARNLFEDALEEARRNRARRRSSLGLKQWVEKAVDKLGSTPPEKWHELDDHLLKEFYKALRQTVSTVEAELNDRGVFVSEGGSEA